MSPSHIFISYRSLERDFATRLAQDIRNAGFPVWMDRLSGIKPGDDWIQALQDALNNSIALIAIMSPEYVESDFCRKELKRAIDLKRPVFPVLLKEITPEEWPLEIQAGQYVDFQKSGDPTIYAERLKELLDEGLSTKLPLTKQTQIRPVEVGPSFPGRELEEDINNTIQASTKHASMSRLVSIKLDGYKRELTKFESQWIAAFDSRLRTLNAADLVILDNQLRYFEAEIKRVEAELLALGA